MFDKPRKINKDKRRWCLRIKGKVKENVRAKVLVLLSRIFHEQAENDGGCH